ncbi:MAG: ABC transporter permease [Gemmatimonadaceae bacterium]|jgi:ABC-type multidrug transport system permease subunit|nr:ABC transporter permease [Gemmatimonadaceae bacterium]
MADVPTDRSPTVTIVPSLPTPGAPSAPSAPPRRPWYASSLVQLTLVRWREFIREPEIVFWTFVFPLLLATGLGIAFREQPEETVTIGVLSARPASATAMRSLDGAPGVVPQLMSDSAAARALRAGKVALVLDPVAADSVRYVFDVARPEARAARQSVDDALQRAAGRVDPVRASERRITEKGARYIDLLIPGLLALNLMGGGIWPIAFSIVSARQKKLLKRFVATPMSRVEYLTAFLLFRMSFLVVEVAFLTAFGMLVFGVPQRGAWAVFALVNLVGALAFSAMGLLLGARPKTIEGVSGLANLAMLPGWVLSGVFFSASNFPDAVQPLIRALPLTAAVDALRLVMLEGAGLAQVMGPMAVLAAWTVVCFVAALRLFVWR